NMNSRRQFTRRNFLRMAGFGIGGLALTWLLNQEGIAGAEPQDLKPRRGHFPARARAMVHFMQNGGPSQMDLFDPKPELQKRDGQSIPESVEIYQKGNSDKLLASPFPFQRRGQCGMELADVLPHLGTVADEITLVRSMYTEHNNHTEALVMMSTGKLFQGRPSVGAWISYALGTENQNLPAYVVLRDPAGYNTSGKLVWSSGWLPALYQGTEFSSVGAPVLNLRPGRPVPETVQRDSLDFLAELNRDHQKQYPRETELEARIQNYELAARMQLHAAEAIDLSKESAATRKLYGLDDPVTASYGTRCLMARRLIEAGVRFVQVFPPTGQPWDAHGDTKGENEKICGVTDLPVAGFIKDMKERGLLASTLVLWTGEFGRLPVSQNGKGRDHNRNAFSLWLAGGGIKAGHIHGATDDFAYKAVTDRVGVPDLHATLLHQLGLDHRRLSYPFRGRDETLTDAPVSKARVVAGLVEKPPEIHEEEKAPAPSIGLSGSLTIEPKKP
ncbi:MAG TPA: DUF1501 domain-containing protein, partial [Gemmataceae bacterium]|nr:DUF1501 domain-containing protein [Gemmataceae bacterium]